MSGQVKIIDTSGAFADVLKFGTMYVIARILSGKGLQDGGWQSATSFALLGFAAYHLMFKTLVNPQQFAEFAQIADDSFKFGTMFVVARILSGQTLTDRTWQLSSLFVIVGFMVYNLVTATLVQGAIVSPNSKGVAASIDDAAKWGTMFIVAQLLSGGKLNDSAWQRSSLETIAGLTVYHLLSNM